MKHLIIYCHPNPKSFCHGILETVQKASEAKGHSVRIRDLYATSFNPILSAKDLEDLQAGKIPADIRAEQEHVIWAEQLTIIYPIWWSSVPALLKGYIDRVFSLGFAYSFGTQGLIGLLKGKRALILSTQGASEGDYQKIGMFNAMKLAIDEGIFKSCGMEVEEHAFFTSVPMVDVATRKGYLTKAAQLI